MPHIHRSAEYDINGLNKLSIVHIRAEGAGEAHMRSTPLGNSGELAKSEDPCWLADQLRLGADFG
jgi:hypothetical protein